MSNRFLIAFLVAITLATDAVAGGQEPLELELALELNLAPLPLNPSRAEQRSLGVLNYRGGFVLSGNHGGFGGFSGLLIDQNSHKLVAVTDKGKLLIARMVITPDGQLTGLTHTRLAALKDRQGKPLSGRHWRDAESLSRGPDGQMLVGFERNHRIWRYGPDNKAVPFDAPPALAAAPFNGGLEALTRLADGRILAITEDLTGDGENQVAAWIGAEGNWQTRNYVMEGGFHPTGATTTAVGDVLVIERRYNRRDGVACRIRLLKRKTILTGDSPLTGPVLATLKPPVSVDNFEAIAVVSEGPSDVLLAILSDDNFSTDQRTLLMVFAWDRTIPGQTQ